MLHSCDLQDVAPACKPKSGMRDSHESAAKEMIFNS